MKLTKLSLIATLAISSAIAGGDIAPVEPAVEAPAAAEACNANTTVSGKAVAYYYTDDNVDLFDGDSSQLGAAVTVDVAHKITDNITANIGFVGFTNLMDDDYWYMEGQETGAIFNVANITATFGDTTLVAGRQILDTPMLKSFDWLLAPESYEAYTLVNSSIENLTLVGSYVAKYRAIDSGENFMDLTDIGDGNNWTIGAAYATDAFNASLWYYNVDVADYTQVYVDAGTSFSGVEVAAQYIATDYGMGDGDAFGIKASTEMGGIALMAAYNSVSDAPAGYVGADGLYTSSWNVFAADSIGDNFKVEASGEFSGLAATASYAYYDWDDTEGHEFDLILGYGITDCISVDAIYTNTDWGYGSDNVNALELIATYKF